ncbi:hypothetical protein [Butyrivibrio sp. AE2005]|uniref:hypothetical protein n=1 Tax=Butyrivibrio sp. AE2005 TaxID=1496722 RepID=UPI00047E4C44|nr:hypothetical protein [Butyrivibrio sp. AE2005]
MDISRPFVYAIGLFLITVFIVQVFYIKFDQNVQSYVDDAVTDFVNDSCASGYMSPESYLKMARKINNTGNLYTLSMIHEAKVVMPYVKESGKEVKGSFVVSNSTYNKEEILEEMFPVNTTDYYNYMLNNGDYVKVTLNLKEPTPAGRLFAFLSGTELKTIEFSYGAYVGNREENGMVK